MHCWNCWALTLRTVCLSTEWAIGILHSWLKHFNCWWKSVKNLICYSCIFNVQLHVHLKKWSSKFKLRYLKNYVSYYNTICSMCCVITHIQNLKVWLKSVLRWLKYNIFSRGLFFIGAPCTYVLLAMCSVALTIIYPWSVKSCYCSDLTDLTVIQASVLRNILHIYCTRNYLQPMGIVNETLFCVTFKPKGILLQCRSSRISL